jgi:bifunctional non-homologous end joining protein LigD
MSLVEYKRKRKFSKNYRAQGRVKPRKAKALSFVIQKERHIACTMNFRLEMEGCLKSWAVPKGIPTTKGEKRLAMHVEDHPMITVVLKAQSRKATTAPHRVLWEPRYLRSGHGGSVWMATAPAAPRPHVGEKLKGEWTRGG